MKKTLRVGVAASQARFDLEHRPSRYQRTEKAKAIRSALRCFFASIVEFSPKFRGRISKFDAEFIPSRRVVISAPHHAP
jgi:hypothetical protein